MCKFVHNSPCIRVKNQAGTTEVAVKVVRREFFKQDPKVRENLDREIRILKLLRGCEYVVQLYHVQVREDESSRIYKYLSTL